MIITRDDSYRRKLLDEQRSRMGVGVRRTGLHVSDLVFCTRKAWAERVTEFVGDIDDTTVLTFVRGLSHEDLFASALDQIRSGFCFQCQQNLAMSPEIAETQRCPDCGERLLVGTIDWVEITEGGVIEPVEMKSTLKSARKDLVDDMPWYLDQLKSYLFMHGQKSGYVCVLHIMGNYAREDPDVRGNGPKPELVTYRCEWQSEDERTAWGQVLARRAAWVQQDMGKPPLGEDSPAHNYICDYCTVGQMLPDGTECERFPWVKLDDGRYARKGSKVATRSSIEDMMAELAKIGESTHVSTPNTIDSIPGNSSSDPDDHWL